MFRNLITVTFRNFLRNKFFSILNITGLTVGLTATVLLGLYIYDELTYDHFHEKLDRIVRVNQTFIWGDIDNLFSSTGPALKWVLDDEVPEFEMVTRIHQPNPFLVSYEPEGGTQKTFDEDLILAADSNVFSVFTFPLTQGNPHTCLHNPNSVVITPETATKYFGAENPMGKTLLFGKGKDQINVSVTGVTAPIPNNSHIQFDFLLSMNTFPRVDRDKNSWIWTTFVTFGLLHENANIASAEARIPDILNHRLSTFLERYRGMNYEEYIASGKEWMIYFQPLAEVHLKSKNIWSRLNQVGSMQSLYILGTTALLTLLISIINFVNLVTARATNRLKEVGIRKVIGSGRKNLISQFLSESVLYTLVSGFLAIALLHLTIPYFNIFTGKDLDSFNSPEALGIMLLLSLTLGLLGGLYPAFYMTAAKPASILKGRMKDGSSSSAIRNALVMIQFAISIILIASSLVVFDQMRFTREYDLGFDRSNKLIIQNVHRLGNTHMDSFEEELRSIPLVDQVTISVDAPPSIRDGDNFHLNGQEKNKVPLNFNLVDEQFVPFYDIPIVAGRNFRSDGKESDKIIINETAMRSFGYQHPQDIMNITINYFDKQFYVVGVIADFTYNFSDVVPAAIIPIGSDIRSMGYRTLSLSFDRNLSHDEMQSLISDIETSWYALSDGTPFQYTFLDQEYASIFSSVLHFGKLLSYFAALAVFIACLGLIGLIAFVIEKRTKEIGIRKILGASATNIILILSGQFGKLLLLGLLAAVPLTWYAMSHWLESFDFHTEISWSVFLYASGIMLSVALLTTSFQTLRAAWANPVDSIRDE